MTSAPIRLGLIGIGKIARDQHLPALAASSDFTLVAVASRHATVEGVPSFATLEDMLAKGPPLDAVSICTPPKGRDAIAAAALSAGKHVMLEKPPGATVSEVDALARQAQAAKLTLYASWHSRAAAAVSAAKDRLAGQEIRAVAISWREDIRKWHPGQDWILGAGGFGVFDPGINALSIATGILPGPLAVRRAALDIPANRQSPIAASLEMSLGGTSVKAAFDFLQTGPQTWNIEIETGKEKLVLSNGGAALAVDGRSVELAESDGEYPALYRRFATLIRGRECDVDLAPLQLVADAYLIAERKTVAAFEF